MKNDYPETHGFIYLCLRYKDKIRRHKGIENLIENQKKELVLLFLAECKENNGIPLEDEDIAEALIKFVSEPQDQAESFCATLMKTVFHAHRYTLETLFEEALDDLYDECPYRKPQSEYEEHRYFDNAQRARDLNSSYY